MSRTAETRYLITHQGCDCRDTLPVGLETPQEVALWFWGRAVNEHVVYEGECPYRFATGDVDSLVAALTLYPFAVVRHALPLIIPLIALHRHGHCLWRTGGAQGGDTIICEIGDLENGSVRHRGMCCYVPPGHVVAGERWCAPAGRWS